MWVRIKPLREIVKSDTHPYVSWATHENYRLFWSKGPCDDAQPIARYLNKVLNQELYNREKMNRGVRGYDPEMITDVEALADWRPDSLIPINTFKGARPIQNGIFEFQVAGLNGTIDLVTFVDQLSSRQMGISPGAQGLPRMIRKSASSLGEMQQVDDFIGTKNKSYKEAYAEIGLRFFHGLEENLTNEGMAIKLVGTSGIEWTSLKKRDLKHNRDLEIKVTGGADEAAINEAEAQKRMAALAAVMTVNPEWKDRQMLKNGGFSDEEIKEAFSMMPAASQELMSEAAQSIQKIEQGKPVELNQGANAAFMQKIIDYATHLSLDDKNKEFAIRDALYEYAMAHVEIAASNEARSAVKLLQERQIAANTPGAAPAPNPPMPAFSEEAAFKKNPVGSAVSLGLRATNAVTH